MNQKALVGVVGLALVLSGCSMRFEKDGIHVNEPVKVKQTSSKRKIKKVKPVLKKKHKKTEVVKKNSTLWNKQKSQMLNTFMKKWSAKRQQKFTPYVGKTLTLSSGAKYPEVLEKRRFVLGKKTIKIGLSLKGENKYDYNVVAIYNDNFKKHGMHLTYLFTLHRGKGVILIDESKNVNPLVVHQNSDKDLNKEFQRIINLKK
ncbi:DUF4767 domain-containing protein [Lactobacillus xujianguonis]|uniref:DUF4767 domain-containing protein n=1 Tax=Lactobacillus xujianguonis TaxID=2495899 RepID=A0A437SUL1_9LACO|nr:DUF4767 domain-containing protein [Lactobacillus xujianguonis]RVU70628.1 DUF4767 domain-containing protein [Lactobacillus xujianguonis]